MNIDFDDIVRCTKHGAGKNDLHLVKYQDGDCDVFCWCGVHLAAVRDGKLFVREEVSRTRSP
jgi:hypothetical protein